MFQRKYHFVINPRSSGGATGKAWQELESMIRTRLGEFTYDFTDAPGAATRITAQALRNKPDCIVVVGGDGTISEVVNGYFAPGVPARKPPLAVVNRGTGGDFCRSLGVPADLNLALEAVKNGRETPVDVGRLTFRGKDGKEAQRFFINVAGCGMAGEVVSAVNQSSKRFGGLSYFLSSAGGLLTYRKKGVVVEWPDGRSSEHRIVTLAICNGQFFGGGMQISPESRIGDGWFDIVFIEDWNMLQSLWYSKNLYNGTIQSCPGVNVRRAQGLRIKPAAGEAAALIDCDGEDVGSVPLNAEILPAALRFRV
ncbi:MAG: diacylglycerol kinase family lipid kinase [Leptospirales bacterium]|nr:diacylglycerol kinase family lipid kinase [Leptospirales bacterium]